MSCIYKYKGKNYTKEEFYSLVRTTMVQPKTVQKYNKILFPTGNTASRIEGHATLEEENNTIDNRIKTLEFAKTKDHTILRDLQRQGIKIFTPNDNIDVLNQHDYQGVNKGTNLDVYSKEESENPNYIYKALADKKYTLDDVLNRSIEYEKNRKQYLEREGFGALRPIYNFYENTVANILNKTYGKVQDYSNTPIKNGVDNLFEESKELSKIGNKQQYSQYLDTIFPDSKVKDIVYHGTPRDFEKFIKDAPQYNDQSIMAGVRGVVHFFSKSNLQKYFHISQVRTVSAILDIRNPTINKGKLSGYDVKITDTYKNPPIDATKDTDGFILNLYGSDYGLDNEVAGEKGYAVFEPEQIHILGSKQDIEGFREFVKESSKPKISQITDEYGNTWNEVTLNQIRDNKKILLNKEEGINISKDPNLRSTYFPDGDTTTLADALKKIAQSNSVYSAIAKKLLKFSENTNTTIELVPTDLFKSTDELKLNSATGVAYYSPKENKIYVAENALFYNGRAERTLLHEILHSISHYSLQGTEAANDFNKLFEYAKANLEHSHALDDVDEFLVALFTKPEFIKKLQQLKPLSGIKEYKNLLEEIFDYLLKLVGITKQDSLYTQAFNIATNILENERLQNEINHSFNPENIQDLDEHEEYIDPESFTLRNLANNSDEDEFNENDTINFDNIRIQEESKKANTQVLNEEEGDTHSINLNRIINTQIDKLRNLQTELQKTAKNDTSTKDRLRKRMLIISTSVKNLQEKLGWSTLIFTQNKMIKNGIEILDKALQSDFKYVQNIIDDSKELILMLRSVHSELQDEHKARLSDLENNLGDLINKFKTTSTKVANDIANEAGITYQDTNMYKKDIGFFTKFFLSVAEAKNIPELQVIAKYLDYTKNKINQLVHDLKDQVFKIKQDNLDWKDKIQKYFDSNGKFITKYLPTWEQKELEELKKQDSIVRDPSSTKQQKAIAYTAMENWYIKNSTYQLSDPMTERYNIQLEEWEAVNADLKESNPAMYDAEKFIFEEENSPLKYLEYIQQKKINPNYYVPGVKRRVGYRNLLVLPNDTYINPAFESIKDDAMYNFIVNTLIKSQSMLPRKATFDSGNFDKFLHEFTIDLSEKDPFTVKGLLSGLNKAFTEWYTPATENTDLNFAAKDSKGNDIEFILNPNIDKFMKSNPEDIFDVLTKFYEMALTYKNNTELLPTLQIYSDKLNERSAIKINKWGKPVYSPKRDERTGKILKDENGKIIKNDAPDLIKNGLNNARDLVLFTIKSQIFGETKTDSGSDFVFWGDKLINYTRLLGIGLKPFSALNNYIIGTINNYAWAAKNLDFDEKERLTAMGIVSGNIFQAFNINKSLTPEAKKLTLLLSKFNVFGEQLNKFEQDTQNKLTEMMYFLMTSGEHLIHSEGFVAKMLHTKLTKLDGTEGNLWDYFTVQNDLLTYNTKEYGEQNFTEITPNSLMNNWLYQFNEYRKATQGDYSNPLYINQKLWGRALMIFRRWIPQAAYQRFGEAAEDGSFKGRFLSIGDISELFQEKGNSKGKAWAKTVAKMVGEATYYNAAKRKLSGTSFEEEYSKLGLSTIDVQNMRVNIREMRMAAWALAIIFALGAAGGDDDNSEGLIASANLAERIFQDLTFFQNPASATSILRNPFPVITGYNKLKDLGYAGYNYLAHNSQDTYQRGFYKGYSKLGITALKATPGAASITSTISVLENKFNSGNSQYTGQ